LTGAIVSVNVRVVVRGRPAPAAVTDTATCVVPNASGAGVKWIVAADAGSA
jgi:hypothetical protein